MKIYFSLFIALLLFSNKSFSQENKNDSIPSLFDDYSNWKQADISIIYNDFLKIKANAIVIINRKIFKLDDRKFKEMDKSKIKKMEVIKDEESKSGVKYVIIITTK